MSGCLEDLEGYLAQRNSLAVVQCTRRELGIRARTEGDLGTGRTRQLEVTGEKVGVKVRVDDQLDPGTVLLRRLKVLIDIAARVDDHRSSRLLVGEKV